MPPATTITLGIDLSSQPANTAACLLAWRDDAGRADGEPPATPAKVISVDIGCDDDKLDSLIEHADLVAIDAPFGWPDAFRAAVLHWDRKQWDIPCRDTMRFRQTDLATKPIKLPLSVSTDSIALPAMRAMCLLHRHGVTDKSGTGEPPFFEVYPAAALKQWGLPFKGYKDDRETSRQNRRSIVRALDSLVSDLPEDLVSSDDQVDALVASLTARCIQKSLTLPIPDQLLPAARTEGWIHVPKARSIEQLR